MHQSGSGSRRAGLVWLKKSPDRRHLMVSVFDFPAGHNVPVEAKSFRADYDEALEAIMKRDEVRAFGSAYSKLADCLIAQGVTSSVSVLNASIRNISGNLEITLANSGQWRALLVSEGSQKLLTRDSDPAKATLALPHCTWDLVTESDLALAIYNDEVAAVCTKEQIAKAVRECRDAGCIDFIWGNAFQVNCGSGPNSNVLAIPLI